MLSTTNKISLSCASTSSASLLLSGGKTLHSQFSVPININEDSMCNIRRGSRLASLITSVSIIVIDEATMIVRYILEALDRTLRDLMNKPEDLFGGILIVLAGDFKQCLPVVPRGGRSGITAVCLNQSPLWAYIIKTTLTQSRRLDPGLQDWRLYLENIGTGVINNAMDQVELDFVTTTRNLDSLIEFVYPDLYETDPNSVILATINSTVDTLNTKIIDNAPGVSTLYRSIDHAISDEEEQNYPTEFLNTLEMGCLPPHNLRLKIGTPIVIIRNIQHPVMVNGTRAVVSALHPNVIEAIKTDGTTLLQSSFLESL